MNKFAKVLVLLAVLLLAALPASADLRDSTTNSGVNTPSVAVPAGVQADDIVILTVSIDTTTPTFTPPTGFTELFEVSLTLDGQRVEVAWKRLTAADSGSYTYGGTGFSSELSWVCQAFAFSGRHTTDPPVATQATNNSGNSSPVTVSATGVTAVEGDDLLWLGAPDVNTANVGNGFAAPTNYTEQEDDEDNEQNGWSNISGATRLNVAAGATGTISGTFSMTSGTSGWAAYLVRIPTAGGGPAPPPSQLPTLGCCGVASFSMGNPVVLGGTSSYTFHFSLVPDLTVLAGYPACDAAAGCQAGVRICQAGTEEVPPGAVNAGDTQISLVSTRTRCADFFAGEGSAEIYLLRKQGASSAQAFKAGTAQYSAPAAFGVIP